MTAADLKWVAAVQRWADNAPPLTERQKDIISAAFCGAIKRPKAAVQVPDGGDRHG